MTKKLLFLLIIVLVSRSNNAMEKNDLPLTKKRKTSSKTKKQNFSQDPLLKAIYNASRKEYAETNADIKTQTSGNYWKACAAAQEEHDYKKAKIFFKAAAYENDIEAISNLGQLYFDEYKLAKSEAYLRQYIMIKLKFTDQKDNESVKMTAFAFYKLGEIYEEQNHITAALKSYEIGGEMGESEGYRSIANIYENKQNDVTKAETYYWKAINLNNSMAFNKLCQLYNKSGDNSKLQSLMAQENNLFHDSDPE